MSGSSEDESLLSSSEQSDSDIVSESSSESFQSEDDCKPTYTQFQLFQKLMSSSKGLSHSYASLQVFKSLDYFCYYLTSKLGKKSNAL